MNPSYSRLGHSPNCGALGRMLAVALLACAPSFSAFAESVNDASVDQIFAKHCLDCHSAQEPEAKLVLDNFAALMKGGESGPSVIPGKSADSLLIKMVEGSLERDGKRRIMPPGKRPKLSGEEIALLKSWIDSGAVAPTSTVARSRELKIPKVEPRGTPKRPIHAIAYAPGKKWIAVARYGEVELVSAESRTVVRTLQGHKGSVNALAFSSDGKWLFAAGGEAGLLGEVRQWDVGTGKWIRTLEGHADALYAVALSPDNKTLATGSYDQKIKLWNAETGAELKTLSGHNGAVFDLAFRPDSRILASASSDRTVKLWEVASGERRDTLSQSLKDVNSLAFSPDGKRLYAGGADNRIRIWEVSDKAQETTNPLLESRFAHEGAILRIAFSSDGQTLVSSASDQTLKLWSLPDLQEKLSFESQPDWGSAVAFVNENKAVAVGRLDGSFEIYDAMSGKAVPPPKPQLTRLEPRGIQAGATLRLQMIGSNFVGITAVKVSDPRLKAELLTETNSHEIVWIQLTTPADLPRGAYELSLQTAHGESGKSKVFVDDFPQRYLLRGSDRVTQAALDTWPVSAWATHQTPGTVEEYSFSCERGKTLVFQASAKALGSKSDIVLTLSDADGKVLASATGVGTNDPALAHSFAEAGQYRLRVSELVLVGSEDHFYRLSAGTFPWVTGYFPLSVPVGKETAVQLIGRNLPADAQVTVKPEQAGEFPLPLDLNRFRAPRAFSLLATDQSEVREVEPNDKPDLANRLVVPCAIAGRIWNGQGSADPDYFRFTTRAGARWVIETTAAQRGAPIDTKIEVFHPDGRPVERILLQAVRDSAVTFRGIDSESTDCRVVNWEEMELNQYLYLQGEVVRLFRAPQGPDSGFLFYSANGRRRCYFGTSPAAHAVDEPCFIVEPRAPGAKRASNGLPSFPVFYANDDDSERKLGTDSKLIFDAPTAGEYLICVTDARGLSGEPFVYRLQIRPIDPDFNVVLKGANLTVNAGSGQSFAVAAERQDGFDGPITVSIDHLPIGFSAATPLVIEAGHSEAQGTIHATPDAPQPSPSDWALVQVTASADVEGRAFVKAVNNFGSVRLGEKPKLLVFLEPDPGISTGLAGTSNQVQQASVVTKASAPTPLELTIAPGETIPALLRVQRNGYTDLLTFSVENLPHGIIVDNIGLNGVLIPKEQSERQVFISAARWVPETDRLCYAVEGQAGRQTSRPVLLHVRKNRSEPSLSGQSAAIGAAAGVANP